MLEKFEIGKRYIFKKELHAKVLGERQEVCGWVDKVDGKEVIVKDEYFAVAGKREYNIIPMWCEEV